jgi:formylglycine-generating enzyme required for sulfatase activity
MTIGEYAWYCGNTNSKNPVAQNLPNGYGLYDMHGNVAEMTLDYPSNSNTTFSTDTPGGLDPLNLTPASTRVARGGSYQSYPSYLNVNQRHNMNPQYSNGSYGFRLVIRAP